MIITKSCILLNYIQDKLKIIRYFNVWKFLFVKYFLCFTCAIVYNIIWHKLDHFYTKYNQTWKILITFIFQLIRKNKIIVLCLLLSGQSKLSTTSDTGTSSNDLTAVTTDILSNSPATAKNSLNNSQEPNRLVFNVKCLIELNFV